MKCKMTKKELLENKYFNALPNDVELVFRTSHELEECYPLQLEQLTYESKPNGKRALVIDALPRPYLESTGMFIMPD